MKNNDYVKLNMGFIKNWGIQSEDSDIKKIAIDLPFGHTDTYLFFEKDGSVLKSNIKHNNIAKRCKRINDNILFKIYDEIDKEFDNKNGEYFEFHFDENKRILTITDLKFYIDNEEEENEQA